jgi:hypothetical protein
MNFKLLTCDPEQSKQLVALGILPLSFLWHIRDFGGPWETITIRYAEYSENMVPAWTKAELDAMIGPRYSKPELWTIEFREKSATDPNTYPVFMPEKCMVFEVGAQASAQGLIYLLENEFINPAECNERYMAIFKREHKQWNPSDLSQA